MNQLPMPEMWVYRDGRPVPLLYCGLCRSFHVAGEHGPPKLVSVKP